MDAHEGPKKTLKDLKSTVLVRQMDYEEDRRREEIFGFSCVWGYNKGAKRPAKKRKIEIKFPARYDLMMHHV